MITKTHKGDLGLGLPEKKKKKKKVVPEPETSYLVLNSDSYFTEACPTKAISSLKNVVHGQALEVPPVKKKKKKKGHSAVCEEPLKPEPKLHAGRTESSPGPRKQVLLPSESLRGERKKRKSTSPCARVRTSPDPRQGEEVTRVGKKLKKHKKEKKAQEATAFSAEDPWLCEAGDASYMCSAGKDGEERAALGQKRKQGSPEEHKVKTKKRKKIRQKGDSPLEHPKLSRSEESCPKKGSKKKPVRDEAPEYIPIGDGPKTPAKKKLKSKKKAEPTDTEKPALKRKKKKKRQESRGAEESWEEEPDTDLEVVLEKKGNMDEAHIDQVRRKALQEEIDRESGKTEAPDTKKCQQGTQFGQWDTAGFENEEQKLKFLKLMGGFKNLSASLGRAPAAAGRPSMALSKQAADALQQNLQRDYDRALSWKHSRGAGLGFSPAPDKIFYIDRNASKSVKFGD